MMAKRSSAKVHEWAAFVFAAVSAVTLAIGLGWEDSRAHGMLGMSAFNAFAAIRAMLLEAAARVGREDT
jgi:hypothetical protein